MSEPIQFRVCTIVNRAEEHERMRASFTGAGFDTVSTFTMFDNRDGNRFDPYRSLDQVIAETAVPYIIFCHQDILIGEGQTPERLLSRLRDLDRADPQWMVAGNAGFDASGEPILHLNSAGGNPRCASLPRRTYSLDEDFLVLKARSGLSTSAELHGFHLYGTDLCLRAYQMRGSAYVLDFVVTHLSPGNPTTSDYKESVHAFENHWRKRLVVGLIRTTCKQSVLSSSAPFEFLLSRYATISQFLWDVRVTLVFQTPGFQRLRALAFMLAVLPMSLAWRFFLRAHFLRLCNPGALIRWHFPRLGNGPKRILFLNLPIEFYSPVTGGAISTIIAEMTRVLEQRGHEVSVMTRMDGTGNHPHGHVLPLSPCGAEDLNFWQRQIHKVHWRLHRWDWPYLAHYRRAVRQAAERMTATPEVVVLFNDLLSPVFLKELFPHARIHVWLQNEQSTRADDLSTAQAATWRWLTCSRYIREWTLARYRFDPDKVTALPSGVNLQQFRPRADLQEDAGEVRVLFVGRLNFDKGPDIVVDAVAALRAEGCRVRLTVAGSKWFYPQRGDAADPYLIALREKMARTETISLGHVPREQIGEVFRQHDVVCVLSRWNEPFGLVALEAMASGCAVIASDRGGLPEACGGGAELVDPDDPAAVRAALRRLVADRGVLQAAKDRALRRSQSASWETTADRFEELVRSA